MPYSVMPYIVRLFDGSEPLSAQDGEDANAQAIANALMVSLVFGM
ncbi:hypothetical protein GCM10010981_29230 [Dyella nitratireducens]|uniref:Uncharacterized protein n=1 Tax=Dyella nitratireducens TaxID=1849580 RepID=A0ABQ1G7F3_9GAMM|nr:hypothetical protein GCM10010981_29230 [Dyella nitratireducens]GLQ40280.1 hypothetical protein GCM10007902_01290 [Dyella nitratireducens]